MVSLAFRKPKELGYQHELLTTRMLASHAREHGPAAGDECLNKLAQGPLVAQAWVGRLKNHIVIAANVGLRPGWVHFAASIVSPFAEAGTGSCSRAVMSLRI